MLIEHACEFSFLLFFFKKIAGIRCISIMLILIFFISSSDLSIILYYCLIYLQIHCKGLTCTLS